MYTLATDDTDDAPTTPVTLRHDRSLDSNRCIFESMRDTKDGTNAMGSVFCSHRLTVARKRCPYCFTAGALPHDLHRARRTRNLWIDRQEVVSSQRCQQLSRQRSHIATVPDTPLLLVSNKTSTNCYCCCCCRCYCFCYATAAPLFCLACYLGPGVCAANPEHRRGRKAPTGAATTSTETTTTFMALPHTRRDRARGDLAEQ